MKHTAFFTLSLLCFIISCKCNQDSGQIGRGLGLEMQRFTLTIGQDTIVRCKGGMVLRFCTNTFVCAEKQFVLEVQEVRDRGEAFLLGISTLASDGRLLETEGMIYLNGIASNGAVVSINPECPIQLEIPAKGRRAGMKWFKGNQTEPGMLWTEIPDGHEFQADLSTFETGQQLFLKHCIACHCPNLSTPFNGPALGNVTQFRSKAWLRQFTRNSQALIASGDSLAACSWNAWKPSIMPSNPNLSDAQIDAIYQFIEEESARLEVKLDAADFACLTDLSEHTDSTGSSQSNTANTGSPKSNPYFGKISSFGWRNCDRFIDDTTAQPTMIQVKISNIKQYDDVLVGLLFDQLNANVALYEYENGQFGTYRDYEIKLPRGPVRLVAIAIKGKSWFKYEVPFNLGPKNIFTADLQPISAKELEAFIGTNAFKTPQNEEAKQRCVWQESPE